MSSSRLSGIQSILGTAKKVVDTLEGRESACSCENSGRGSSGRRTLERSSGFAVGGTPEEVQLLDLLYAVQDRVELPADLLYHRL